MSNFWNRCQPCLVGQYSGQYGGGIYSREGDGSCIMCPNGTYGLYAGSVGCVSCPVGQYSTSPGSLGCLTCGFRQTNSPKSDSCVCIAGSSTDTCLPCAPGLTQSFAFIYCNFTFCIKVLTFGIKKQGISGPTAYVYHVPMALVSLRMCRILVCHAHLVPIPIACHLACVFNAQSLHIMTSVAALSV